MTQYTKYFKNQNMHITYDEILKDFSEIKPTFNPILDICTIKMLGTYIYNKTNFEKWIICPNLIDEIINLSEYYHYLQIQNIIDIIKKAICENKNPSYLFSTIYYFVSDSIKNNIDNVNKYFEIKTNYNDSLNKIKLNYQENWDKIEKEYDIISNILCSNFSELETDTNFQITTDLIDSIGNEASYKVNKLITECLIKETTISFDEIKREFDIQMDEIYEKVIESKKFNKIIHDAILEMYGVQKEIHRMALTLENTSNILRYIKTHL